MRRSRFSDEQIVGILKAHEAGEGATAVCRRHGISEQTLYRWKGKYGGLPPSEAKRLKALEDENSRLKKLVADQALDNQALKELLRKNWWRPPASGRRGGTCSSGSGSRSGGRAGWWGWGGRRRAIARGPEATTQRCVVASGSWLGRDPGSGTGAHTSCCGGRGSWSTTSGSNGSTG